MQADNKITKISHYLSEVTQNPNAFWEILSNHDSFFQEYVQRILQNSNLQINIK